MRDVIKNTWFPTTLMIVTIVGGLLVAGWIYRPRAWELVMELAVITPPVWWWLVVRRPSIEFGLELGRGAAAGALSAAIACAVDVVWLLALVVQKGFGEGEGAFTTLAGIMALAVYSVMAIAIGAASGLLAALLQRRWSVVRTS